MGLWVDRLLSNGASVSFNTYPNSADANFPPGNYASGQDRMNIGWLADFYMVIPNSPDNLAYELQSVLYNRPFESFWYEAIGANVGIPLGPRSIYREGTDPNGRSYRVWARDFENVLVLSRPLAAWNYTTYDDTTGVAISLPAGDTYIPLYSDGTFGAPTNSITLRNVEAAILIKQSRLSYINSSDPMLQFNSATYSVSEGAATATITVTRGGAAALAQYQWTMQQAMALVIILLYQAATIQRQAAPLTGQMEILHLSHLQDPLLMIIQLKAARL